MHSKTKNSTERILGKDDNKTLAKALIERKLLTVDEAKSALSALQGNDNTLEGFRHREYSIFTAQYHPEASPGPHDARYMFAEFKEVMQKV